MKYCYLKYIFIIVINIFDSKMNLVLGRDIFNISNYKRNVSHHTNTEKNIINQYYAIILHYIIEVLNNLASFRIVINYYFMIVLLIFSVCARIGTYLWIFYYYYDWGKKLKCEKYCTRTNSCTRNYIAILILFLFLFSSQNINLYLMYLQFLNQFVKYIQMVFSLHSKIFILALHLLAKYQSRNLVLVLVISIFLLLLFFAHKYNLKFKDKYKNSFPISTVVLHYIMVDKQLESELKKLQFELQLVYTAICFIFYVLFLFFQLLFQYMAEVFDLHSISCEFSSKEEMYRESMVLRADIIWLLICLN